MHPPALAWAPSQAAGRSLLHHELPWAAGESQVWHLLPTPVSPTWVSAGLLLSHLITPLSGCHCTADFPLLKHIISEVLPPSLTGSVLASSGCILQPAGIGSVGHEGTFWQLLTENPLYSPPLPKLCHATPIQLAVYINIAMMCGEIRSTEDQDLTKTHK